MEETVPDIAELAREETDEEQVKRVLPAAYKDY
jgi:hypothetical protein